MNFPGRARALARSLEGRSIAVLLLAILIVHAGALLIYRRSAIAAADDAFAGRIATQLSVGREAVLRRRVEDREAEARVLSSSHLDLTWARTPSLRAESLANPLLWSLRSRIVALEPSLAAGDIALGLEGPGDITEHTELSGSLALPDGTFLNFRSDHAPNLTHLGLWALLSTAVAIGVGLAAIAVVHRIAGPLRDLARSTEAIGHGAIVPVREAGPDEIKGIARALNAMQARIHGLVGERTQALAAVSHDLRTPITRLRLRTAAVPDEEERRAIAADLDDMQSMIESTLAYLRGDADPETPLVVNVASLLLTIVDEAADAGSRIRYEGPSRALATVRPVALKRALANLVDNALRYGGAAHVTLAVERDEMAIVIDDDGPGIAEGDLVRVFAPFERLDASRNRSTGGTGLGLTIALKAVERDGGRIILANRPEGGLRTRVILPPRNPDILCHDPDA